MKRIFIFYSFILLAYGIDAQLPIYTFAKTCGFVHSSDCSTCTGGYTAAYFDGITIYKNSKVFAQLPTGWSAKQRGDAITFFDIRGKQYIIRRAETEFLTMVQYRAAIDAMCVSSGGGTTYLAGAGINISGDTIINIGDISTSNELQTISKDNNTKIVTLSNGGGTFTDEIGITSEVDGSVTNEIQVLSILGQTLSLSVGGGSVTIPTDGDGNSTNEIQTLSISGQNLSLSSGGGTVALPTFTEVDGNTSNEGSLTVGIGSSNTSLIRSNTVPSSDIILTAGSGLTITESIPSNTITLFAVDGSTTNELQTISIVGQNLTLSNGGGTVVIPSATGESTTVTNTATISNSGTLPNLQLNVNNASITPAMLSQTYLTSEVDGSVTNEIQTLSIAGQDITLSNGGGTITLPTASGIVSSKNGLVTVLDTVKLGGNLTENTVINGQKLYTLSDTSLAKYSVNTENATHISSLEVKPASNGGVYAETYEKATPTRKAVLNLNANDDSPPTMIRQTGNSGNCGMYLGINAGYMNMSWNNTGGTDYTNLQFDANGIFMNGVDPKTSETNVLHYNTTTKEITFGAATVSQNSSTNGLTGGAVITVGNTGVEYYGADASGGSITINTDQTFLATAKVIVKADNNGTNSVTIVDNGTTTMVVGGVNGTVTSYTLDLFELVEIGRIGNVIYINK